MILVHFKCLVTALSMGFHSFLFPDKESISISEAETIHFWALKIFLLLLNGIKFVLRIDDYEKTNVSMRCKILWESHLFQWCWHSEINASTFLTIQWIYHAPLLSPFLLNIIVFLIEAAEKYISAVLRIDFFNNQLTLSTENSKNSSFLTCITKIFQIQNY